MAHKALPPVAVLRQLLRYEPDTGRLFWLPRPTTMFSSERDACAWNARFAGAEAFTAEKDGYRVGRVFGRLFRAHRAIWALMTGEWPEHEVDHRHCRKNDNRWEAIRPASHAQNTHNRPPPRTNTSGFKGVTFRHDTGKYTARITAFGLRKSLGCFVTPEDAGRAYAAASARLHGEFSRIK